MTDRVILFESEGSDPAEHRLTLTTTTGRATVIAVPTAQAVIAVAQAEVQGGTSRVELCGGLSVRWRAPVAQAVGPDAVVSSTLFGIESLAAAADYSRAYEAGEPTREVFLVHAPGLDPDTDRGALNIHGRRTDIVPVPDAATAVRAATALVDEGYGLIELYGDLPSSTVTAVIDAVAGRAAVGSTAFGVETASLR